LNLMESDRIHIIILYILLSLEKKLFGPFG
jgi:hypothetical protein